MDKKKKNSGVRFIRVRGRIIPIKNKKRREGVGLAIGGLTGSAAIGYAAGRTLRSATKTGRKVQDFTRFAKMAGDPKFPSATSKGARNTFLKAAGKQNRIFNRKMKISKGLFKASGLAVTSSVVGIGFNKIIDSYNKGNNNFGEELSGDLAGIAVGAGTAKTFHSGLGRKALKKILSKGKL